MNKRKVLKKMIDELETELYRNELIEEYYKEIIEGGDKSKRKGLNQIVKMKKEMIKQLNFFKSL